MRILVTGSIAYDTIMVFPDRFKNHLLPEQLHILNVCFLAPEMRREYGGCAGNIAYNLRLLGEDALMLATVGDDIDPYLARLRSLGLDASGLRRIEGQFTAQAFITTDLDDNQIIAFHPGAMNYAQEGKITRELDAGLAIIAPDGKEGMLQHARQCQELGVPFVFDPGQGLPMFSGEELAALLRQATYAALNDYEGKLLEQKTGRTLEDWARELRGVVLTLGARGSLIWAGGQRHEIPCAKAKAVVDPTGCGDAYRAGLLYGIAHGWDWESIGRLGSVMGALKVASRGAQNHVPERDEIEASFQATFGYSPWKG